MKKIIYIALLVFFLATIFFSCKSSFPTAGTLVECNGKLLTPTLNPTKRPEFDGGKQAMFEFFRTNLTPPQNVANSEIKGKIRVAFVVTKEGEICDVRITSKPRESLDKEVIRVIKIMPKWIPGIHKGKIVDSYVLLDFALK